MEATEIIAQLHQNYPSTNSYDDNELDSWLSESLSLEPNNLTARPTTEKNPTAKPPRNFSKYIGSEFGAHSDYVADCYEEGVGNVPVGMTGYENMFEMNETASIDVIEELKDLIDPSFKIIESEEQTAESYPHNVGAANHDTIIRSYIDDFKTTPVQSPRVARKQTIPKLNQTQAQPEDPFTSFARNTAVENLNIISEDLAFDNENLNLLDAIWTEWENMREERRQKIQKKQTETVNAEKLVRDLHSVVPTGSSAGEELLEVLLGENRQSTWDRSLKDTAMRRDKDSSTVTKNAILKLIMSVFGTRFGKERKIEASPAHKQFEAMMKTGEKEVAEEFYERIRSKKAARTDGIIEFFVNEIKKLNLNSKHPTVNIHAIRAKL
ncbi:hypothetical protein HK098_004285 [Nowakowskiella sp. JEL0407]|nr:hypothetical protein HK098_004285 [Nowakowskiella sp. JEL0407]